jgi:hypothetical protein
MSNTIVTKRSVRPRSDATGVAEGYRPGKRDWYAINSVQGEFMMWNSKLESYQSTRDGVTYPDERVLFLFAFGFLRLMDNREGFMVTPAGQDFWLNPPEDLEDIYGRCDSCREAEKIVPVSSWRFFCKVCKEALDG